MSDWEEAWWDRSLMIGLVYGVMLVLVGFMFYLCCLYGILFTPKQARAWVLASLVAFAVDIVLQEPLVQLLKVLVLFVWRLGNDSARAIVVASIAGRAGVEPVERGEGEKSGASSSDASLRLESGAGRSVSDGKVSRVAPLEGGTTGGRGRRQRQGGQGGLSLEDLILHERLH